MKDSLFRNYHHTALTYMFEPYSPIPRTDILKGFFTDATERRQDSEIVVDF